MENSRLKSVILLSGGLDSAANLAFAKHFDDPVLALTADYGQKAAAREIEASKKLCEHFQVQHQVLDLKWLGDLGGSALTSSDAVPEVAAVELELSEKMKKTAKAVWVPNRNGVLINVAAAYAERMGVRQVVVGFNKEEAETFPDNSSQFLGVISLSLKYSTANGVKVSCYTDMMDKTEIVRALKNLPSPFPFDKIWSCYQAGTEPCGKCESCQRLYRALALNS